MFLLLSNSSAMALPEHYPDCPSSPNCASSRASDPSRLIEALPMAKDAQTSLAFLSYALDVLYADHYEVIESSPNLLHAVLKSRLFGFLDDVIFELDPKQGKIHLYSRSRTGYWDLGVNRKRLEEVRQVYMKKLSSD